MSSNSGRIMQLISISNNVHPIFKKGKSVNENIKISLPIQQIIRYTIPRSHDLLSIDYLVIEQPDNICRLKNIKCMIGGNCVLSLNYNFISQIIPDSISHFEGKTIYKLNINKFWKDPIKTISLPFASIQVLFEFSDIIGITNIELVNNETFLYSPERREMAEKDHNDILLVNNGIYYSEKSEVLSHELGLSTLTYTNGLFIETDCINDIQNIKINMSDTLNLLDYNRLDIHLHCKKINNNLLYLPLSNEPLFSDDYSSGVAFHNIDNSIIIIDTCLTNNPGTIRNITIHSIEYNMLIYKSGIANTKFNLKEYAEYYIAKIIESQLICKVYEGDSCPITLEPICEGDKYIVCDRCNKAFGEEAMRCWMATHDNCPHCRYSSNMFQIIYINSTPEIE